MCIQLFVYIMLLIRIAGLGLFIKGLDNEWQINSTRPSLLTPACKDQAYFAKRRVDIKEEGSVDVVAPHLSKVSLVPATTYKDPGVINGEHKHPSPVFTPAANITHHT